MQLEKLIQIKSAQVHYYFLLLEIIKIEKAELANNYFEVIDTANHYINNPENNNN